MKTIKTALSLLLMLCMILSLGTVAFAMDQNTGYIENNTENIEYTNNGKIENNYADINENAAPSDVYPDGGIVVNNNSGVIGVNGGTVQNNGDTVAINCGTVNNNAAANGEQMQGTVYLNEAGGVVVVNNGQIDTNEAPTEANPKGGEVTTNNGTIGDSSKPNTGNYGTVGTNGKNGTVTTNNGTIGDSSKPNTGNYGTVDTNDGKIVTNGSGGTVKTNNNIVETNRAGGTIENNSADGYVGVNNGQINTNAGTDADGKYGYVDINNGTITDNHGVITINTGTVEENYGEVVINYGGTVNNKGAGSVDLQYYGVEITTENTSDPVKTGFDQYQNKDYLSAGATGTVTVAPTEGNILDASSVTVENGSPDGLTVETNGSGLLLTFKNLLNNLKLKITGRKNDPKPDPKPKPAPAAADLSFSAVKFTFNLDGGTLDGETGKVVKWFVPGATVKLPAAPTKTDSTFAGWQTKVGGEVKVFQAGEKFTVTGAQNYTALWE